MSKADSKPNSSPREFEVRYWLDSRKSKPITRGFPKTELGAYGKSNGAAGAIRAINQGFASKVQCVHRPTERVLWTAKAAPAIPGVHVRSAIVMKGDPDLRK